MKTRKNEKMFSPKEKVIHRRAWIIGIVLIVISIIISGLYLFSSWNKYEKLASSKAVTLAQSLETLLTPEHIAELYGTAEDLENPEYIRIKHSLSQLIQTTDDIKFAYLMGIRDDNLVFLVDSEYPDSPGYSLPGQVYDDAKDVVLEAFQTGETIMTGPTTDRWGTWYNALVPVKDSESGQVIAAFGLDFPASEWLADLWYQMVPDMLIALLFIFFIIALYRAGYHYFKLKVLSDKTAVGEALYHSVFNQVPIGIAVVDDKRFVSKSQFGNENMNPRFEEILGRTSQELAETQWTTITHPDDLQYDLEKFEQFKAGEIDGYSMQKRFLKPNGSYIWTHMKITHFLDRLRDNPMHLCLLDDITKEKEILDSLSESERSKLLLLSNLPGMAYRCNYDRDWTMQFISAGCYDLTGYSQDSLIKNKDLSFNDLISPEYRRIVWNECVRTLEEERQFKLEYEITTASDERKWVVEIGKGIYNEKGKVEALEGIILDITDRKKAENELLYNYQYDIATGLYNRNYFDDLIVNDHEKHLPIKKGFVIINTSTVQVLSMKYGFNYTQDLIIKIAEILKQYATENRILARLFENRFIYYVKGSKGKDELMEFSQQIADAIRPILASERIGAGIGVYEINPDEELDLNQLSKKVLIASEKAIALEEYEVGICYYDDNIKKHIERDDIIDRELNNIATHGENGSLYLEYQPIFDLKANAVCGFEALARLKTEELGQIPPAVFIPVAEQTKLIVPIGWIIARQALRFLNRLESLGYDKTSVSINFSPIQLIKSGFTDKLFEMINEMQVNPTNICIEMTEAVFASSYEDINLIMQKLRNQGISVAIDDFGTGYSSLSRERELNINCVKIDKYFIDKLLTIRRDNAITSDVISIAHKLGHYVIAEGVEYEEQKQYLLDYGCDKIQGYLIGKPLDEEAVINLLENQEYAQPVCFSDNSANMVKPDISPETNKQLQQIMYSIPESIFGIDTNGIITSCNNNCVKAFGYDSAKSLIGEKLSRFLYTDSANTTSTPVGERKIFQSLHEDKAINFGEEIFRKVDGTRLEIEYNSYPEKKDEEIVGSVISFIDTSDRKNIEYEFWYYGSHDSMTGLYNRSYYEELLTKFDKSENLPLSVVYADIDGLKLTNDVFGHKAGDELIKKTAEILKKSCRDSDFVARIGGDKFIILMPRTTTEDADKVISRIKGFFASTSLPAVKFSISLGRDTKNDAKQPLEVVIGNAESSMYNDKTVNHRAISKDILDTLIGVLHSRSPREKQHSIMVSELCGKLGAALNLSETEIYKLKRAGYLHDIGKINVEESLLQKDSPEDESKIQMHSAAGYRILNLCYDTLNLAEYVYAVHERWDGSGYPLGLSGEQIPMISRIISIADSYENWLNDNIHSENAQKIAIENIRAESGKMFDPDITESFIKLIEF